MERILEENKCTGCTACVSVCTKNAIEMQRDTEGFLYPVIIGSKCNNCGACECTCPTLNTKVNYAINECYIAYNKTYDEKNIVSKASSGGVFELVANYVLESKGVVIGAEFNQKKELVHTAITNTEGLDRLKGSKYLESNLNGVFKYIKENISDKKVLFVGTPCQVAGLKSVIRNNKNLITIDIVCHGVPTPKLFGKYVSELEIESNDILVDYDFRDRSTGWDSYSNTAVFKHSEKTEMAKDNNYMKLFLCDIALRRSCYDCNFKLGNKYSDLTLGDFWGVNNYYPEMYNKNGVSAIILNTAKGIELFGIIKEYLKYKPCKLEEIVSGNSSLQKSSKCHAKRRRFFKELDEKSIGALAKKYYKGTPVYRKAIGRIKKIVKW